MDLLDRKMSTEVLTQKPSSSVNAVFKSPQLTSTGTYQATHFSFPINAVTSESINNSTKVTNENGADQIFHDEEDEEVIEEAHRYLLSNIFDTNSWEPLTEEIYLDKQALRVRILNVIANSGWNQKPPLLQTLDQKDGDNQSLLNMVLTRLPTKRNSNNTSPRDSFARRKDLVRFLMNEYPQLYSYFTNDDRTVLKAAHGRAQVQDETRPKVFATEFINLLVTEYPEETAQELNKALGTEESKAKRPYKVTSRGPLCIQELIPVVKGLPKRLLDHLKPELVLGAADEDGNSVLHLLVEFTTTVTDLKELVTKYQVALSAKNKLGHSPYQHRVLLRASLDSKYEPEEDEVANYLKNECMHLSNLEDTIQCLYGASKDCEIYLDLRGALREKTSEMALRNLISRLRFETILRYVYVPIIDIQDRPVETDVSLMESDKNSGGRGRKDCALIFRLLWEKGVRKIITVIVEEQENCHHTDEIISGLNLHNFDVEELNWKIKDLCCKTIRQAAPNLKTLFLYSSGNNAVLRSWSTDGGLNKFAKLEKVHVKIIQKNDSVKRLQEIEKAFKKKLEKYWKRVRDSELTIETQIIPRNAETELNRDGQWDTTGLSPRHTVDSWIQNMQTFAIFLENYYNTMPDDAIGKVKRDRQIKVAIIDDGINLDFPELTAMPEDDIIGQSFYKVNAYQTLQPPWYSSSRHHGTLMARLIWCICPKVRLYIARLHEAPTVGGNRRITTESAEKAVNWAISQGVDIISMSWTIPDSQPEGNPYLEDLKRAIDLATERGILMFGSASDQGLHTSVDAYPGAWRSNVICIGAAKESGQLNGLAAGGAPDFAFPGHCGQHISPCWDGQSMTGSSVATALAGGLAAVILYCVELTGYGHAYRKELCRIENMKAIFAGLIPKRNMVPFVAVQDQFPASIARADYGEVDFDGVVERIIRPFLDRHNIRGFY